MVVTISTTNEGMSYVCVRVSYTTEMKLPRGLFSLFCLTVTVTVTVTVTDGDGNTLTHDPELVWMRLGTVRNIHGIPRDERAEWTKGQRGERDEREMRLWKENLPLLCNFDR